MQKKHGYKILKDSKSRRFFLVNTLEGANLQYALTYPALESLKQIEEDLDAFDKETAADNDDVPF